MKEEEECVGCMELGVHMRCKQCSKQVFCASCWEQALAHDKFTCPLCRAPDWCEEMQGTAAWDIYASLAIAPCPQEMMDHLTRIAKAGGLNDFSFFLRFALFPSNKMKDVHNLREGYMLTPQQVETLAKLYPRNPNFYHLVVSACFKPWEHRQLLPHDPCGTTGPVNGPATLEECMTIIKCNREKLARYIITVPFCSQFS